MPKTIRNEFDKKLTYGALAETHKKVEKEKAIEKK